MRTRLLALTLALVAVIGLASACENRVPRVQRVDFAATPAPTDPVYRAELAPAGDAPLKEFRIPIEDAQVKIADGIPYSAWTLGGTVPGPVIRVRQGDRVRVTVVNQAPMPHSIDFHAARVPMSVDFRLIMPHDSITFEFIARDAGAYLVHCGTPPVLLHLMQGMYLPIIVDPRGGWPDHADKEFVLVQSEFYAKGGDSIHPAQADFDHALGREASYVTFNGRAFQYQAHPLHVDVGDRVRIFVVNAGPSLTSDFHIVGTLFDRVYPDGDPGHALTGVQTWGVAAGSGAVFETHFSADGSGAGTYAFVTHAFADAAKGAVGLIQVGGGPPAAMAH